MENDFTFASQAPLYSITNAGMRSTETLDQQAPFDFYTFLKYSRQVLSPIQFNDAYQRYLTNWSKAKQRTADDTSKIIRNNYIELLKDITLNYLTFEERRFITAAINTTDVDPLDLDILIPFYSKKIREICNFYADKREKLKYRIKKIQEKGNRNSLEQSIFETLTDYVFTTDEKNVIYNVPSIKLENIINNLEVEVEELYDLYSSYFDNDPSQTADDYDVKTQLRIDLYTSNINAIEHDIFINFDEALKKYIFDHLMVFISSLGESFTVNINTAVLDLSCATADNPLCPCSEIIDTNKEGASRMLLLKKRLIEKYIGADFYYIRTDSTATNFISGVLFEAENPSGNLLNRHFPTTASVEETSQLHTMRQIGLFFRPEKNGLLYFSAPEKKYKIDTSKLEPNKTYIYPDPELYGNTTGLTNIADTDYPLIHIQDYNSNILNASFHYAEGDIKVSPYQQSFYAYYSRNQLADSYSTNLGGLSSNLAVVVDRGILTQWSSDIFGNQYGLFKRSAKKYFIDDSSTSTTSITAYEYYDGAVIKFDNGQPLPEKITSDSYGWVDPNVFASDYYYNTLFDGGIGETLSGVPVRALRPKRVYDGYYYNLSGSYSTYINNSAVDGINTTYDSGILIECGLFSDVISIEADFNESYVLSSIQYRELDGGPVIREETGDIARDSGKNLFLLDTVSSRNTQLLEEDTPQKTDVIGQIFVRDVATGITRHLSAALSAVISKYSDAVTAEILSSVVDFNVYDDVLYVRTTNYFILDKLTYDDMIIGSSTNNNSLLIPTSAVMDISQPFFFENKDYALVCKVELLSSELNKSIIKPTFYRMNYNDATLKTQVGPAAEYINILKVRFARVELPIIVYNSRNKIHTLVATLYDGNDLPYIFQMYFDYDGSTITDRGARIVNLVNEGYVETFNFGDYTPSEMFTINRITNETNLDFINSELVVYGITL
jgi:hypothetical protein